MNNVFPMVCRKQVQLRQKGHRIYFGDFHCENHEKLARDYSEFLKRYCQDKTLTGGCHHRCAPEIFQKFELHPHKPLAPICKQLPNYNKEDPGVVKAYADFAHDARERIDEMLLDLDEKPVDIGLNSENCSFISVSQAKRFLNDHYNDWEMLAELVHILGTEGIMARLLTEFSKGASQKDFPGDQTSELQGGSSKNPSLCHSEHNTAVGDHSAWSQINQSVANVFDSSFPNLEPCQINPLDWSPISSEDMPDMMSLSEAKRSLNEHFLDKHWLILAEIVKSFEIDTVSLLFEDSSFEQKYQAGSQEEASVTFQERNCGYVNPEHR